MKDASPSSAAIVVTARDFQRQPGRYQRLAQGHPVTITAHGQPSLVVMSITEYQRLTEKQRPPAGRKRALAPGNAEVNEPSTAAPTLRHVLSALRSLRSRLEARGIAHAGVFGSVAREAAKPSSDIDVVVTPQQGRKLDLFDLGGVQELLNECFEGVDIDLVVEPIRRPELLSAIRQDRMNAF